MTVVITRHGEPGPHSASWAEALGEDVAADADKVERVPGKIDIMFSTALLHLQARCTVDPRAAQLETWEATVDALQIGSAMFAVTGQTEGAVDCRIHHKIRHIPAIGPRPYADAGNWLTAFWLAIVCRDQKRMTELCEVPLDRLRSPEGTYDEYIYHWVAALQAYWLQRPGLVEELTAALQGSHPDAAAVAPRDLLQHILYPPINLFYRFLRKDHDGFNQALVESLELHKAYWTADEDRAKDPEGRIALAPLAIACLAHDGEIPIEVESDYLPKHLLQRGWLGEFEV
ncbi:immunity 49 family protein [Streptomyces sp. TRM72054]|uniref:immunity 49 family protein n=1 Tax=Streptomyces sp. TRM72054 TaxID=2870562 RepID=UPI001C8CEFD4|nr:immunity 49 family protein [Streptomyces sp. TRM72054]MBX9396754.1 immunity 49 family protein [Streptomyces sp. TRM72054]